MRICPNGRYAPEKREYLLFRLGYVAYFDWKMKFPIFYFFGVENQWKHNFHYALGPHPVDKPHIAKGVSNRREALSWIRKNAKSGVIYMADDDNSYDRRIFEEVSESA